MTGPSACHSPFWYSTNAMHAMKHAPPSTSP